jgi:hypothetical protein
MLLAFSNMMLFEMRSENAPTHWTKIYVIVTISTMLIEDIRKVSYLSIYQNKLSFKTASVRLSYTNAGTMAQF